MKIADMIRITIIVLVNLCLLALGAAIILLTIDESLVGCSFGAPVPSRGPLPDPRLVAMKERFTLFTYIGYAVIVAGSLTLSLRAALKKKYLQCGVVLMLLFIAALAYPAFMHAVKKAIFGLE